MTLDELRTELEELIESGVDGDTPIEVRNEAGDLDNLGEVKPYLNLSIRLEC